MKRIILLLTISLMYSCTPTKTEKSVFTVYYVTETTALTHYTAVDDINGDAFNFYDVRSKYHVGDTIKMN